MINLTEQYEKFFGKNSLHESDYEDQRVMAKKLNRKKIGGYEFEVDRHSIGAWSWYDKKTKKQFYATPWATLAAKSSGGSGPSDTVDIEAYDEKGDLIRGIPNSVRYKHSGNVSRDLSNYLKVVKLIARKLK